MDANNSHHINSMMREDLIRLIVTIGAVVVLVAVLAFVQSKTNIIGKLFPSEISNPNTPSAGSPTPAP